MCSSQDTAEELDSGNEIACWCFMQRGNYILHVHVNVSLRGVASEATEQVKKFFGYG